MSSGGGELFEQPCQGIPDELLANVGGTFISDEMRCSICSWLVWVPVITECEHIYCRSCLERWLARSRSCPTCQKMLTGASCVQPLEQANRLLYRMIGKINLKCKHYGLSMGKKYHNSSHVLCIFFVSSLSDDRVAFESAASNTQTKTRTGCEWKGAYSDYAAHLNKCDFELLKCVNAGCPKAIPRGDYHYHIAKCPYQRKKCRFCGKLVEAVSLEAHASECYKDMLIKHKDRIQTLEAKINKVEEVQRESTSASAAAARLPPPPSPSPQQQEGYVLWEIGDVFTKAQTTNLILSPRFQLSGHSWFASLLIEENPLSLKVSLHHVSYHQRAATQDNTMPARTPRQTVPVKTPARSPVSASQSTPNTKGPADVSSIFYHLIAAQQSSSTHHQHTVSDNKRQLRGLEDSHDHNDPITKKARCGDGGVPEDEATYRISFDITLVHPADERRNVIKKVESFSMTRSVEPFCRFAFKDEAALLHFVDESGVLRVVLSCLRVHPGILIFS
ncbi:unnamed protein product [Vitrella brassicaformis CCMP3155]|uniref:RING-type domain-containing protein n=1 Tax=Vitrella brassicaformis (strain CCMP3155) TaxID=1169540 RepID=A0A0G4EGN6_VITBC|nr:unnamed protein product [Vitrella brassicaformis CCMP3155]|eukprot:CEL94655.1 unnamed protein product [Vitrella brassicaformis CCMP3155]